MDPLVSGRGAEPVYRDKVTGKRVSKEEDLKSQQEKEKKKPKEINPEWRKGLAPSRDDPELNNILKERMRWGDPMAHLAKKKKVEHVLPDLGADDKMTEIPPHSRKRSYGIKPRRHWDGVDNSNAKFYRWIDCSTSLQLI